MLVSYYYKVFLKSVGNNAFNLVQKVLSFISKSKGNGERSDSMVRYQNHKHKLDKVNLNNYI